MSSNNFFKIGKDIDLSKGYLFSIPDVEIAQKIAELLIGLEGHKSKLSIETPLKKKSSRQFSSVKELIDKIMSDLNENYTNYSTEFKGEPLEFRYILGRELMFKNSVEIIQVIFHSERNDIGNLYYSMVVKYHKGQYYYWGF